MALKSVLLKTTTSFIFIIISANWYENWRTKLKLLLTSSRFFGSWYVRVCLSSILQPKLLALSCPCFIHLSLDLIYFSFFQLTIRRFFANGRAICHRTYLSKFSILFYLLSSTPFLPHTTHTQYAICRSLLTLVRCGVCTSLVSKPLYYLVKYAFKFTKIQWCGHLGHNI